MTVAPATSIRANVAQLSIRHPDGQTLTINLTGQRMVIGRSPGVQIRLDNPTISRHHAEVFRDPFGRWWIRDLGSRNGIRFDGQRINERALLDNDSLQLGEYELVFIETAAAQPPAAANEPPLELSPADGPTISALTPTDDPKISASHLEKVLALGNELATTPDPTDRLRHLCRFMTRADFNAGFAATLRIERKKPDTPPHPLAPPSTSQEWTTSTPHISRSLLRSLSQRCEPLLASNVRRGQDILEISIDSRMMSIAAIACPLRHDAETIDALYATLPPHYGTKEWLSLAALAARQYQQAEADWIARKHIQAHAVIEQELEKARQIQLELLPRNVSAKGLDVAIRFEPCRWIGGDYVDVLTLRDGKAMLIVADVAGKGLPAALIAARLHTIVHTSVRAGMGLGDIVANLNSYLREWLPTGSFVTMLAITIDSASGALECINAGHPPALIISHEGEVIELQSAANSPFGVNDDPFDAQTSRLERNQLLAMFTDGLTELFDLAGNMLGEESLAKNIAEQYVASPNQPLESLAKSLDQFLTDFQSGCLPHDDRTSLLARRAV